MAWLSAFDTIRNYTFRNLEQYVYHEKVLDLLSVPTRNNLLASYRDSIGAPEIDTQKRIQAYFKARTAGLTAAGLTTPSTLTPGMKKIEPSLVILDSSLKQIGGKYHPDDLVGAVKEEQFKAVDAIKAQQASDLAAVKTALDTATPAVTPEVRAKTLSDLEAAQKAELKSFDDGMTADRNAMFKAAQAEYDRVPTLATMYENNKNMRKLIDQVQQNKPGLHRTNISFGGPVLADVSIDDVIDEAKNNFTSLTGRPITATKSPNGAEFNMVMPGTGMFESSYHNSRDHNSKVDLLFLAQLVRATGAETIVVKIECADPKMSMKLAREAFEACRETGYDEKSITITVNNKTYKADDLFKFQAGDDRSAPLAARRSATEHRAETAAQGREQIKNPAEFKREMLELRTKAEAAAAAAGYAPTPPAAASTLP